jgi:eukaryotic-like serine/threonine-protein kinase
MSLIGKTLNQRFYILEFLAPGGFGHTYLAEDRGYQARHHCVVKHLSPAKENLPYLDKIKKSFEKEADTLAKLSLHTNLIPKLIDRFEEDGELYLVQEFIPGAPLSAELTPDKQLDEVATIELLIQILTPLNYCHVEGLIHRDLKPANIMRSSKTGELVLIDFGLVKDMGAGVVTKRSYGGTPGYAPEEQFTHGLPEPASDVYAVGMIAIQALTGIYPHQLQRNPDTMEWDLHKYCDITDEFTKVLNQMVEFFAIRRYQNAGDALAAVKSLPSGNIILSIPTPNSPPPPPQPRPAPAPQPKPAQPTRRKFRFETAKLEFVNNKIWMYWLTDKKTEAKITRIPGEAGYITEDLGNGVKLEMVYIKAGSFMMGSNESSNLSGGNSERPIHQVNLSPFYMGKYTITQQQYQAIMGTNPSHFHFRGDNRPVESVSWDEAMEFCQKLSQRTKKQYTLPSESQWEYACRAGTTTRFYFGEMISPDLANYNGIAHYSDTWYYYFKVDNREQTTNVGSFPPNAFGLYDMHGNVNEWCLDGYHDNYNGAPTDGSSWLSNDNHKHILRGGSWHCISSFCHSASRTSFVLDGRYDSIGFRVVALPAPGFS